MRVAPWEAFKLFLLIVLVVLVLLIALDMHVFDFNF
jgi:hypothetical protein